MTKDRPTEVDYINGYIAELGRKYHYEASTHLFVTQAVHLAEFHRQNLAKQRALKQAQSAPQAQTA